MSPTTKRSLLLYSLFILIGAVVLFRLFLPVTYSGDDLQYTTVIERSVHGNLFYHPAGGQAYIPQADVAAFEIEHPASLSLNPRYLLEWPTSALVARIWDTLGWSSSAYVAIQAYRILVGGLGLVCFFLALHRLTDDQRLSLLITTGFGISAAYFTYSTHMDQSINMLALLCLAFYIMVWQIETGFTWRGKILLAAVVALASLYNFTAALSALAFGIGIALLGEDKSLVGRFRTLVTFGLIYVVIVAGTIAAAVIIFAPPGSLFSPGYWSSVLFGGKPEYNVNIIRDALRAAIGLAKSQALFPGIIDDYSLYFETATAVQKVMVLGFFAGVLVILFLPFVVLAVRGLRGRHLGNTGGVFVFLIIWLASHSLFNWFWDPGFNKYWLVPLAACWTVAALALAHLKAQMPRFYRPAWIVAAVFIGLSFFLNLATQFLPQCQVADNPWLTIAQTVKEESQPSDLFITTIRHPLPFYLVYFAHRDTVSTNLIVYDQGGDSSGVNDQLQTRIADHRADGGKVYVFIPDNLTPEEQTVFDGFFGSSELKDAWQFPGALTIYELIN